MVSVFPDELVFASDTLVWEGEKDGYYKSQVSKLRVVGPDWIYPLVRRLQRRKLIVAEQYRVGARKGSLLSPTPEGRRVIENWIGPPIPDLIGGVPPDPVRTRVRMLGLLSSKKRRAFLWAAVKVTERNFKLIQADCDKKRSQGGFQYMIAIGALKSLEARLSWLREVLRLDL